VRILDLDALARDVTEWASSGVRVEPLAIGRASDRTAVTLARFAAGANLGPHLAGYWQVFAVVDGAGWVSGNDQQRRDVAAGQAAVWEPGEVHESGSDAGMTAVLVQMTSDPSAALHEAAG
jgi:quercetin dioxygenase-like cupin family protein